MGNYRRFLFTAAAEASYLQYCIIEPYIDEVINFITFAASFFFWHPSHIGITKFYWYN